MHSRFYTFYRTTANISDCIDVVYFCMCDQTFAAKFCEDDDLGGGLCYLWSSDDALLLVDIITIIIEIIIMRVTRMMWKRSLSSCSFRPQAKLRKMTQLQRKKNPIKTKHKEDEAAGPWTFFPCILLTCVSTHYRTKWLETIFESHQSFLSTSLLPVWWLFDGSLLTAFCFYFFILVGQNQASMWRGSSAPWNILTNLSL